MNTNSLQEETISPRASARERWLNVAAAVVVVLASAGIGEYIAGLQTEGAQERERARTTQHLALFRAQLEGEFMATLQLTRGMIAWIATHPDMEHDAFQALASEMRMEGRHIRNLGLAPDNVLTFVHPMEGNERAIGLVYAEDADQWPSVEEAMRVNGTVVAGPLELVQGGEAIIARTPVEVRRRPNGEAEYWGLASIVIDFPSLMTAAGAPDLIESHRLAIRGRDGHGSSGEVFYGEASLFEQDPVLMDVALPNGSWQLALLSRDMPQRWASANAMTARTVSLALGMLLATLLIMLLRARSHNRRLAMQDALTGLPNLRMVRSRIDRLARRLGQGGDPFGLVVVDLDGFKEINDRYGHQIGDAVLVEVARRLFDGVRPMDTVARVGGDEFLVVLPGVNSDTQLDTRCAGLQELLRAPMRLQGNDIQVGASVGGVVCDQSVRNLDDALRLADLRMYAQKESASGAHLAPG